MTKDIRSKINRFLTSEDGRVGVRAPLALGVASGTFLFSLMGHIPSAEASCVNDSDCGSGERCNTYCVQYVDGTCERWESECVDS